ncbi:MAG: hydroxylamine reductase [Candidatus Omnitrophota bacterium]
MFCFQCQEAAGNKGCAVKGVCGKDDELSALQDILIYALKGLSVCAQTSCARGEDDDDNIGRFINRALFMTITNANFDKERMSSAIVRAIELREKARERMGDVSEEALEQCCRFRFAQGDDIKDKAKAAGILSTEDQGLRSLKEFIVVAVKGIAAYAYHARILGFEDGQIYGFIRRALAVSQREKTQEALLNTLLEAGEYAVKAMALLDEAHTTTYGHPEISPVNLGVRKNPAILISGHDLKDIDELLRQSEGQGVDIYTHCEMLCAHSYPELKKYPHLAGNYGGSWWRQKEEFEAFNGPIIMTTNCLVPPAESYRDRLWTSGVAGYPGIKHIPERQSGREKDFSSVISQAKKCPPPREIETGIISGGFAHNQVLALADKIIAAIKSGAIKRFIVMAGCDGRQNARDYFTQVARSLPRDTVILTAGCAKYRYNKLNLGDIGGIPRIIDAGQCNDSYSLALVALKLKEVFGVDDINQLPISFDIGWYEQKAVAVLLALLHLGFKGIRLGPTLPAFVSPNVAAILVERFAIKPTGDVRDDLTDMLC